MFETLLFLEDSVIQNSVVQSIELEWNGAGIGKSCQNSRVTVIAKLAGATPLMEGPL